MKCLFINQVWYKKANKREKKRVEEEDKNLEIAHRILDRNYSAQI
jgi:hypothetical protein